ncbi:MAG: SDR family oxidoreductase [Verrucomicrobiota bacterium]
MQSEFPLIWLDGATGTLGQAVQKQLEASGYRVQALPRDSMDVSVWIEESGVPSGLVCMSGVNLNRLLARTTDEDWSQLLEANLLHQSRLVQALLPELMAQGTGSIVLCSSLAARHPRPGQAVYAASKGAVESYVRGLAREVGGKNIRVNAVAPGFIGSAMFEELPEKEQTAILAKIPLGRTGSPTDVAAAVEFLLSNRSAYLTGQTLRIDGGVS